MHNWNELARFAPVELAIVAAVLAYWRLGPDRATGKTALLLASLLVGVLLAIFSRSYQTGADIWELFATWAALIAPWVIIGRLAGLWMFWLALANLSIIFYVKTYPWLFGMFLNTEHGLWMLFALNSLALLCWELAARRIAWLAKRWAARLLAIASATTITLLMLLGLFFQDIDTELIVYPAWLVCAYAAYRVASRDLIVLAVGCLSLIVVVTSFLVEQIFVRQRHGGGETIDFLFIALAVFGMAAASGWWLKKLVREGRQ